MHRLTLGLLLGTVALSLGLTGCATHTSSARETQHRWAAVSKHDTHGLAEDMDLVFMTQRTSRLTRWHSR